MAVTTYSTIDGEIVSETRGGTERDYLPDPLGSTRSLLDNSQAQTDTYTYWPYGETRTSSGSTATPFRYIGVHGYFKDSTSRNYARARIFESRLARWLSKDATWPHEAAYIYVRDNPMTVFDPTGRQAKGSKQRTPVVIDWSLLCGGGILSIITGGVRILTCLDCMDKFDEDISGQSGDKLQHCVAGCLAAIHCPSCPANMGLLEEIRQIIGSALDLGGVFDLNDAVAVDDGMKCGRWFKQEYSDLRNFKNTVGYCRWCCTRYGWNR